MLNRIFQRNNQSKPKTALDRAEDAIAKEDYAELIIAAFEIGYLATKHPYLIEPLIVIADHLARTPNYNHAPQTPADIFNRTVVEIAYRRSVAAVFYKRAAAVARRGSALQHRAFTGALKNAEAQPNALYRKDIYNYIAQNAPSHDLREHAVVNRIVPYGLSDTGAPIERFRVIGSRLVREPEPPSDFEHSIIRQQVSEKFYASEDTMPVVPERSAAQNFVRRVKIKAPAVS